jgi:hypothetical protein
LSRTTLQRIHLLFATKKVAACVGYICASGTFYINTKPGWYWQARGVKKGVIQFEALVLPVYPLFCKALFLYAGCVQHICTRYGGLQRMAMFTCLGWQLHQPISGRTGVQTPCA